MIEKLIDSALKHYDPIQLGVTLPLTITARWLGHDRFPVTTTIGPALDHRPTHHG